MKKSDQPTFYLNMKAYLINFHMAQQKFSQTKVDLLKIATIISKNRNIAKKCFKTGPGIDNSQIISSYSSYGADMLFS